MDFEEIATTVYSANFPSAAHVETASVQDIFDGDFGAPPTAIERDWKRKIGAVQALVGGPPCQGHSTLNNHTRANDPKNGLYLYMAKGCRGTQAGDRLDRERTCCPQRSV